MVDTIHSFLKIKNLAPLCVEPSTLLLWYLQKEKKAEELTEEVDLKDVKEQVRQSISYCLGKEAEKEFVQSGDLFRVLIKYATENLLLDLLEMNENELIEKALQIDPYIKDTITELIIENDIFSQIERIKDLPDYYIFKHDKIPLVSKKMAHFLMKKFPNDSNLFPILLSTGDIEIVKYYQNKINHPFEYIGLIRFIPYKDLNSWFELVDGHIGSRYALDVLLTNALQNTDFRVTKAIYDHFPDSKVPDSVGVHSNRYLYLPSIKIEYLIDNKKVDTDKVFVFKDIPPKSLLEKMKKLGYKATTKLFIDKRIGVDLKPLLESYDIYI